MPFYDSLGIELNPEDKDFPLYKEVFGWLRVPYKYAGIDELGVDCSGLAKNIYSRHYGQILEGGSKDIFKQVNVISRDSLKTGDLLFFRIRNPKTISHIGMFLQNGYFVHASTKLGVTINNLSEDYYKKYFYKAGRLLKFDSRSSEVKE